ncbi:MAG: hypothetical protein BGO43_01740 [Gammaproteobacteria bacterium 39-13]|nr:HDOD domain-containing protein [Gammaproteobacteria bacterium]OJV91807.1 MAG: hypothetical protein BGO43_01740 [Gammaproteobacteria bacterium 39-13]
MHQNAANVLYDNIISAIRVNKLTLPSQPDIAISLRNLNAESAVTNDKIKEIIVQDPALTARIIQVANSPLVRGSVGIDNLSTAIGRLGITFVISFCISLVMKQLYRAKRKIIAKKMQEAWDHACDVSAISFVLAKHFKVGSPEEAMLGGLLHEIGILPILTYAENMSDVFSFAQKYPDIDRDLDLLENIIEKYNMGLSEMILNSWCFPENIASVPMNLVKIDRIVKKADLIDIVLIAKIYALGNKKHPLTEINKSDISAYARLGLEPDVDLGRSIPQIQEAQDLFREKRYARSKGH